MKYAVLVGISIIRYEHDCNGNLEEDVRRVPVIVEPKPTHDPMTQYLDSAGKYDASRDLVVIAYTVHDQPLTNRETRAELATSAVDDRPLNARTRQHLVCIAAVAAVRGYGYAPTGRDTAAKQLSIDLASIGITLGDDAIRLRLAEVSKYLASGWEKLLPTRSRSHTRNPKSTSR